MNNKIFICKQCKKATDRVGVLFQDTGKCPDCQTLNKQQSQTGVNQ